MGKVLGKLMSFKWNGADVDIQSANWDEAFNVTDVTDSATAGDGKETVVGRATRELKIEGVVKSGGIAQVGKNMNFLFNSANYWVTDASYEVTFDEVDVTDSGTSGDGTEFEPGFAERKSKLDLWLQDDSSEIPLQTAQSATLTFATGISVAGNFRPESMSIQGEVKGAQKYSIDGTWQGGVTETGLGLMPGDKKPFAIVYKTGAVSNKEITGTATLMAMSISANINGEIRVSYTIKVNGGVTKNNYAAV